MGGLFPVLKRIVRTVINYGSRKQHVGGSKLCYVEAGREEYERQNKAKSHRFTGRYPQ